MGTLGVTDIAPRERLIVALDVENVAEAEALVARLGETVSFYKIGLQLQYAGGIEFARTLRARGKKVFLDAKLLDIGTTVEKATANIAKLGPNFLTVHAYPKAIRAAVKARGNSPMKILAVTVLTDMDDGDLAALGIAGTARDTVLARARDAIAAGADGVVASGADAHAIRAIAPKGLLIVIPAIRRAGDAANDQARVTTPADAIRAGADHIVVGRPINAAADPKREAEAIVAEIADALG